MKLIKRLIFNLQFRFYLWHVQLKAKEKPILYTVLVSLTFSKEEVYQSFLDKGSFAEAVNLHLDKMVKTSKRKMMKIERRSQMSSEDRFALSVRHAEFKSYLNFRQAEKRYYELYEKH